MKLIRFGAPGQERPGVQLEDGTRLDASGAVRDYDEAFFGGDGLESLAGWLRHSAGTAPRVPAGARLGPPLARPSKIVCIGLNYRDHAAESGIDLPKEPVLFLKSTTSLTGPDDPVVIPRNARKLDWEVELGIVIGRRASYVPKARAIDHVAGYVLHNDYSEREFQFDRGGQWVKGKSADTFAPMGPFLATRDEIPDAQRLDLWLTVNGDLRQKSSTAEMVFDVPTLVSYISEFMTLLPGDVISSGTPAGVGHGMRPEPRYLRAGDRVRLGVTGLGQAEQRVVAHAAPAESR